MLHVLPTIRESLVRQNQNLNLLQMFIIMKRCLVLTLPPFDIYEFIKFFSTLFWFRPFFTKILFKLFAILTSVICLSQSFILFRKALSISFIFRYFLKVFFRRQNLFNCHSGFWVCISILDFCLFLWEFNL